MLLSGTTRSQTGLQQRVALGLYYSGRADLQLGVTGYLLFGQFLDIGTSSLSHGKPRDLGGQLAFRYIW